MLVIIKVKGLITMRFINAWYNMQNNSVEINTYDGYILRIDCLKAEEGITTTVWGQHYIDSLALDDPLKYARLVLSGELQMWVDGHDSFET